MEGCLVLEKVKAFLRKKDIVISWQRYGIEALGAMAQGLFASLLVGTILSTLGQQLHIETLDTIGAFLGSLCIVLKFLRKVCRRHPRKRSYDSAHDGPKSITV